MSELMMLCKTAEVTEDAPIQVVVDGLPPLAVYEFNKSYYVTSDICTHGMAFMTEGEQDGNEIECPFHGGAFNFVTGEVVSMPCHIPLETFPVVINDEYVCIEKPVLEK
ncbi:MAG: non-heme iron oxygenase ferredoxin subunit [Cycloclasticus pugetii]|jgi:ethylbenzene dioxygenase ferredoxin subunit|uniref:Ferredoxin subunits of nitrite reductase and ring-hydroxylating dioxygenase n=2 Tax=Cycloclasticus TaxID=34067 RepID=S5TXQ5_9GAMM|nr:MULTISPECIES: non-heme iron oxygenase ferredoxin subunit [Cycloclasticus]AGS39955.1 Ferredoxin subunits of nitrite reductase and ring-hydroxylating dioxygenase [Cycloclasticus zancles 78-ME]ATI03389.1 non-heme iron oxygenase ferredoxin subunit [Cycloclasticus sp. PY97N]EPD13861.1 PAH dioxygenase component ferredoxin [Cycloclasticus pugetii]SHJ33108.1 ethylbenzene dioxygenase ferredoxin subunit [Cycloclasticus pugetii]|tara:strand:- start:722 stop:1048 length:327 start_codon:yes stop_codon:yes gene_type:complete